MHPRRSTIGLLRAGMVLALGLSALAVVPTASAEPAPAVAPTAAAPGDHNIKVKGPARMVLRHGCRENYKLTVAFDVTAGDDYWVNLRGRDSQGHTIDGTTIQGVANSTGRLTFKRPLLLCGELHDAGVGVLQVSVHVGEARINGTAPTVLRFADRVRMKKPKQAVKRNRKVLLKGTWDRGAGFGSDIGHHNRKFARVHIFFKAAGKPWRRVAKTRVGAFGAWSKKVKVTKPGRYQARVLKTKRYQPARSKKYRVRVR